MDKLPGITEIGYWSEIKLTILQEYAKQYSLILSRQSLLKHIYVDAFAGAGVHISRETKELIAGSPLNALNVTPSFYEVHLIDLDGKKVETLKELTKSHRNTYIYEGDSNEIILDKVFPRIRYEDYKRGLCLLDPYGLHLNWNVLKTAAEMRSVEIFLNFPIMDMNRNVLWHDTEGVDERNKERMNAFWGDDSWKEAVYSESPQRSLFGEESLEKETNEGIANKFKTRLEKVAGFEFVPDPIPMRNNNGATIYYLFFASNNKTGYRIAKHILEKYRTFGKQ